MRNTLFFVLAIIISGVVGCNTETNAEIIAEKTGRGTKEVSKVLTASFWRLASVTLLYENGATVDSTIDKCNVDDLETFNSTGKVTILHGSLTCTTNPADGEFAHWALLNNGTRISENFDREMRGIPAGTLRDYSIDYIAFKKMVISRNVNDPIRGIYKETTTLTR